MNETSTVHATFSIERSIKASPEKVFAAFSSLAEKSKWFGGPPGWEQIERSLDFKICGKEILKNKMPSGVVTTFNAEYLDIVPNKRIIYSYDMHLDEKKISVSLATLEMKAEGETTKLIVTEQGVYLDGYDTPKSREDGTNFLMDTMVSSIT